MKLLQNKFAVILLAVLALGLLFRNIVWPLMKVRYPARPAAAATPSVAPVAAQRTAASIPTPATATAAKVQSSSEQAADAPVPTVPSMNVAEASAHSGQWLLSPKRDPFKLSGGPSDGKAARDLLTLRGVLRQTQSTLVVLNNQVLSVGDSILGFKIESIEDQRVWVNGPNGREQVEFQYSLPAVPQLRAGDNKKLSLSESEASQRLKTNDRRD